FDNVFVATRSALGTLIENSIYCMARVVFPMIVIGLGFMGIFSAQLVAALAAVVVSLALLSKVHGFKLKTLPSKKSMRGKWRFAFGSYTSDLIGGLPASVLPIIVVAKLGPDQGALWYTVMQIINLLLTVSASINQAMFAEMSNASDEIFKFVRQ